MTKKSYKRELIEWAILITVGLTLYLTGLHTEVIGQVQRLVLATGLIRPSISETTNADANYNFQLTDPEGNIVDFPSFKGKTVFINFWATWCPPCVAEMPDIESLYQKTGTEITFVMISLDDNPTKAIDFVQRKGYELPIYFLKNGLPLVYETHSIPTSYVISPEGHVVMSQHGMAKYNTDDFKNFLQRVNSTSVKTQNLP